MTGTWTTLARPHAPTFGASSAFLLTDGRVLCQQANSTSWFLLTPDDQGRYVSGTWSAAASATKPRLYYASSVLADGRVLVAGGEYAPNNGDDTNVCEIYDPVTNAWTTLTPPAGWAKVGDAPSATLADGRVLIGNIDDGRTTIFDPATDTFSAAADKGFSSAEETWALLPDGSVLTVVCGVAQNADGSWPTHSQRYIPSSNTWVDAGPTAVDLIDHALSIEIGPAMQLPDGRVMYFGGTGHTALYTPSTGTWTAGPDLPNNASGQATAVRDAPAVALPNGRLLVIAGVAANGWGAPASFFEYDPVNETFADVGNPSGASQNPYEWRLLLLPDGQVLATCGTAAAYIYTSTPPSFRRDEAVEPEITSAPSHITAGLSYVLHGVRFNGQSQGSMYGDDCTNATNYPLARLSYPNGDVVYCRTREHSTMGICTGAATVSTTFDVPASAPIGSASLSVVANGIASDPVHLTVRRWRPDIPWTAVWQWLIGSLADGPLWAIDAHGHIHPIPPRGPEDLLKESELALRSIVEGIEALQRVGAELQAHADKQAVKEQTTTFLRS